MKKSKNEIYFILKPKFANKEYTYISIYDVINKIHEIFLIEEQTGSKFTKETADKFYEIELKEIRYKDGKRTISPAVSITRSDYYNWTGKDINSIKSIDYIFITKGIFDKFKIAREMQQNCEKER